MNNYNSFDVNCYLKDLLYTLLIPLATTQMLTEEEANKKKVSSIINSSLGHLFVTNLLRM